MQELGYLFTLSRQPLLEVCWGKRKGLGVMGRQSSFMTRGNFLAKKCRMGVGSQVGEPRSTRWGQMGRLFRWGIHSSLCFFFSVNKPEGPGSGRLIQRLFRRGVGGTVLSIAAFQRLFQWSRWWWWVGETETYTRSWLMEMERRGGFWFHVRHCIVSWWWFRCGAWGRREIQESFLAWISEQVMVQFTEVGKLGEGWVWVMYYKWNQLASLCDFLL